MRAFSKLYGSSPLHLLLAGAAFVVSAYAVFRLFEKQPPLALTKWFVGAILSHDIIVLPIYSLVLIGLLFAIGGRAARAGEPLSRTRRLVLNHLRVPAALSLLFLLVFFPLVLGLSEAGFKGVSGLSTDPYLARWLFLSLGLFVVSAVAFAVRLALGRSPTPSRGDARAGTSDRPE